jgi:hypothetical protein
MAVNQRDTEKVQARVEDWRRRLIDLSYRNRLIHFKPTKASTLIIEAPAVDRLLADPASGHQWSFYFPPERVGTDEDGESDAARILEERIVHDAAHAQPRPDEIVVTEQNPRRIARILENLARRSNGEFEDKALRILHLAVGFLDWVDPTRGEQLTSPLVLIPAELRRDSPRHPYRLRFVDDEEIVINPSLTEKLRRDAGLAIPEDWAWEDKPVLTELDEIREAVRPAGWKVRTGAVLGLFSFQKYVMYRDLLDNEELVVQHPIVRSLARKALLPELDIPGDAPTAATLDEAQPPVDSLSILDADASQRLCVDAAIHGHSFVMHGPPGTGKSQTIANVIAELIGRGRNVLFVSEKAAALDVVYKRLAASGLSEYCLLLHGEHASRREVVDALHECLTGELVPSNGMRPGEYERLANLRRILNDSAEVLHLPMGRLGERSLRDVYAELAQLHDAPAIVGAPKATDTTGSGARSEYQRLRELFDRLADRWNVSERDFAWSGYTAERFTADDRAQALGAVERVSLTCMSLSDIGVAVGHQVGWPSPASVRASRHLLSLAEHLAKHPPELDAAWLTPGAAPKLLLAITQARNAYLQLAEQGAAFSRAYPKLAMSDVPTGLGERLQRAEDAISHVIGHTPQWDQTLIADLADLKHSAASGPTAIDRVDERARLVAQQLGQPGDVMSWRRATELIELSDLAFYAENRPEEQWLVTAGRTRATRLLEEVEPTIAEYQRIHTTVLERYTDQIVELDAEAILHRFTTKYGSFLARLGGDYRADKRALKAATRDGKLPDRATITADLSQVAELRRLAAELDTHESRITSAFGSYARGKNTDLTSVHAALTTAARISELSAADCDLGVLASRVCIGSDASTGLARDADLLRAAVEPLDSLLATIRPYVARPTDVIDEPPAAELSRTIASLSQPFAELTEIHEHLATGATTVPSELPLLRAAAELIGNLQSLIERTQESASAWSPIIGHSFRGCDSAWDALFAAHDWLVALISLTGEHVPAAMVSRLTTVSQLVPQIDDLSAALVEYELAVRQLGALFDETRGADFEEMARRAEFADVNLACEGLSTHIDDLNDWTEYRRWRRAAEEAGWRAFIEALIDREVKATAVTAAFQLAYWNRRLESVFEEEPDLAEDFRAGTYQRWIDEFRRADRKLVATGSDRVVARRNNLRKDHISTPGSEIAILRNEAGKRRRHLPVRQLLERLPTLLSELKPCLMMSPLSVSHFLTAGHRFDTVVFDEASQVPPQDAINCIYRGTQLIVAGDNKQLPPTSFFQIAEGDETPPDDPIEDTREDMESILDSCEAILASHDLRWHYRSRHEDLIGFSNANIYRGSLITFPGPVEHSARMGVRYVYVPDGVYDRGHTSTNRREAQIVATRVIEHLHAGDGRTVGVIAFNLAQANAVSEELELLRLEHPDLEHHFSGTRLDAVFVKHLESVQGDERDVIIFSVGYGRDLEGRFSMNFGPLN